MVIYGHKVICNKTKKIGNKFLALNGKLNYMLSVKILKTWLHMMAKIQTKGISVDTWE